MSENTADPEAASLLERFAHRVATRDLPPPRPDYGPGQAGMHACLAATLPTLFDGYLDPRRAHTYAQVCYALMQVPRLHLKALAAATGRTRLALYQGLPRLVSTGLVGSERTGGKHYYFLTRTGEDWVLATLR